MCNYIIGNDYFNNLKKNIPLEQKTKEEIRKIFFPYKFIKKQENKIQEQDQLIEKSLLGEFREIPIKYLFNAEIAINKKHNIKNIDLKKLPDIRLSNLKILNKFKIQNGFFTGINNTFPGSGFIDFYKDNLIILSSRGVLTFTNSLNNLSLHLIKNNINDFIGLNQFIKYHWFSTKDLLIDKNKIYVSYTEEITNDCWNISLLYGDMNFEHIKFKKLFSSNNCMDSKNPKDMEFNAHQSGGRIVKFDNDHILFSTGDFKSRYHAQDKSSINGKIIKINIHNKNYEIISMGHRSPQGLYYDINNNFILETEHGPEGGDEINLIEINKTNIPNYGWAIASYGEHYGGKNDESNKERYRKYPLYKSHIKYGFIEPIKYFVPSIGISEITKIKKNKYIFGSMREQSLYFFELNDAKELINLERVKVGERIRDLNFNKNDNALYLFLEDSASIGTIPIN